MFEVVGMEVDLEKQRLCGRMTLPVTRGTGAREVLELPF